MKRKIKMLIWMLFIGICLPMKPSCATSLQVGETVASTLSPITAKVIVLDPGHCKTHPGAKGNGLREEVAVLHITQACRNALSAYGDVTVYMTREDGDCCRTLELGNCLIARNNYAKQLNADFLISMHLNAGWDNGANVLTAYKSGYNDNICVETQRFGRIALRHLKMLGIANKGLLLRKSGNGNKYPNGKLADYYSIVRNGVRQQIPSVIIEHGYISSSSDVSKFFNTATKRKKVGKADAKAIVEYYNLSVPIIVGTFRYENGVTYYVTAEGKKVTGWIKDDEKWYYFSPDTGAMQTGWLSYGGEHLFLSPSTGQMVVGWFEYNNASYLAKGNGVIVKNQLYGDGQHTYMFDTEGRWLMKGFHMLDGFNYYVDKDGYVVSGVEKINGEYYGFDTDTYQQLYGYQKVDGEYYYFEEQTGIAATRNILMIDGKTYYFGPNGERRIGWVKHKGAKYYFNKKTGNMVKGWKKIDKKYYFFSKTNGKMQKNKWIGKYYVNSKGVRTKKK